MNSPQLKRCPSCKSYTSLHAAQCPACGHVFRTQFAASGMAQTQVMTPIALPRSPARLALLAILGAVAVTGAFYGGRWLLNRVKAPGFVGTWHSTRTLGTEMQFFEDGTGVFAGEGEFENFIYEIRGDTIKVIQTVGPQRAPSPIGAIFLQWDGEALKASPGGDVVFIRDKDRARALADQFER